MPGDGVQTVENFPSGRRREPRISTQTLVWWRHELDAVPLVVCNVSRGGLLCEFHQRLDPGATVELLIEVPIWNVTCQCRCRVAHLHQVAPRLYLVGLERESLEGLEEDRWVAAFTQLA